jgi:hypothetical protein
MKTGAVFFQSSLLLLGVLVVAISLFSANNQTYPGETSSRKYLYISTEILPDHLLYPVLMVVDKAALSSAKTPSELVRIQVNYAYRRLNSAKTLAAKQKPGLALSTLTKSQKYLNQAAQEALIAGSLADRQIVIRAIAHQSQQITQFTDQQVAHNADVTHLRDEAEALLNQLQSAL